MPRILAYCLALIDNEEDQKKFEKLYRKYKNYMYVCAYNKLHDHQLAEDALIIAFTKLAKNMHKVKYDIASKETKYLLVQIINRTAIDMYHAQNKITYETVPLDEAKSFKYEMRPEDKYILADAIEKLPEAYQQVMILRFSENLTNAEIAAVLGYTKTKVEKMISRGRAKLKKILKDV